MHAASVTLLCWAIIGAACFFPLTSGVAVAVLLATLVAVVGLPHGAADHRFAEPRMRSLFGPAWPFVFLTGYLLTAGLVVAGWVVSPALTICLFFVASAWHFGQEEPHFALGPRVLRPILRFARGGLVIWATLLFHGDEVFRLLSMTTPLSADDRVDAAMTILTVGSWFMLPLVAMGVLTQGMAALNSTGRKRRVLLLDCVLVTSIALLCFVANPLVSFLVYFCAWHSARGLKHLRQELGETWLQLAQSLAPLTAASVGLIALVMLSLAQNASWEATLVRSTFVGLSALAIPHLVLHGIGPLLERLARRRQSCSLQVRSTA